jgi:NAD(P)-dependent dehydrogenase (short-subunit alcohol dehydrogenase family)
MNYDLTGLVFVITGGARGMGAATAHRAAASGATVMIADILDDEGQATADQVVARGGVAAYQRCDLADPSEILRLMQVTADMFGGIDVLHNNAAITDVVVAGDLDGATIEAATAEHWDRVFAINLRAPFLCAKAALPYLKRSKRPSIINVSSVAGLTGRPVTPAYGPSKAGIVQLTRTMALEFAPHGIRVNAYAPGFVESDLAAAQFEHAPERREAILEGYLAFEPAHPDQIAGLVCFLASSDASYINGSIISIDGGFTAWKASKGELARGIPAIRPPDAQPRLDSH